LSATIVGVFSAWASASLYATITLFYFVTGSTFVRFIAALLVVFALGSQVFV
jgi:hypothetical protein